MIAEIISSIPMPDSKSQALYTTLANICAICFSSNVNPSTVLVGVRVVVWLVLCVMVCVSCLLGGVCPGWGLVGWGVLEYVFSH